MSVDEDTELRDLVAQTLETNGVLNKIRAELRANVFLALEEQDSLKNNKVANKKLDRFLETEEGQLAIGLVWEFLEFFNLDNTTQVLEPESGNAGKFVARDDIIASLGLTSTPTSPLLLEVLRRSPKSDGSASPPKLTTNSKIPKKVSADTGVKGKETLNNNFIVEKNNEKNKQRNDKGRVLISEEDDGEEDELLRELGIADSPPSKKKSIKPSWLDSAAPQPDQTDIDMIGSLGSLTHVSLKNAPPLPGLTGSNSNKQANKNVLETSAHWEHVGQIDQKIAELGFEMPKDDDYNYDDDFQGSTSQKSGLSITEEIEEDISIGSFAESKNGDLATEDHTISQISDGGYDYAEDMDRLRTNSF